MPRVGLITVSDRVSLGQAEDLTGPAVSSLIEQTDGWNVTERAVVPDDVQAIQHLVRTWTDSFAVDLLLTAGGTGFGVRDTTPEAVRPLLDKEASGLTALMMTSSLAITPMASLSRPICGVRKHTIIVTLPGSVKGAKENITAILPVLGHAIELCRGGRDAGTETHKKMEIKGSAAGIGVVPKSVETGASESKGRVQHRHECHHHHHHKHANHDHAGPTKLLSDDLGTPVKARARTSPYPLAEFDDALSTVLRFAESMQPVTQKVDSTLAGFIVAEDVVSNEAVPGYRASIVDGYAVISSDGPGVYPLRSVSVAGNTPAAPLQPGQIARVTTGAPVPDGADAVIMVEDTELVEDDGKGDEKLVKILATARAGQNIREPGSDVAVGDVVLRKGDLVSAAGGEVGLLASVGVFELSVFAHPTVAILSTGDELVPFDYKGPMKPGAVRDTNLPSLITALSASLPTVKVVSVSVKDEAVVDTQGPTASLTTPAVVDSTAALASAFRRALDISDVVITTGGVSMGEADLIKPVLERVLGATVHFGRVRMKPGKPTTFATVKMAGTTKLIFSLPGNPVSALVGFYVFVLPALRKMTGYEQARLPVVKAKLAHRVQLDPRPEFFRARIVLGTPGDAAGNVFIAHGTGSQLSSRMLSMRGANALLKLPGLDDAVAAGLTTKEKGYLEEGAVVEAWMIGEL
ncbi:hypothetical protein HDU96_010477 [Phlyctochytrium bullatum]|nr:hypothetical protein HDU96_010477 [Phlyctochytrium bullatum]